MTGLSKNKYKFISLMAAIAMFLGLIVTGCSEGDSNPAHVDYDTGSAKLDVIVGLAEPTAKGFDVLANAEHFYVELLDATNQQVGQQTAFAKDASEGVHAWTELEDGALLMHAEVDAENVDKVATVLVGAYDKDDIPLGFLVNDSVVLQAGQTTTIDFTEDDAPAFMSIDDIFANAELTLTTEPAAAEGLLTIAEGEKATVSAALTVALSEKVVYTQGIDAAAFTLATKSTNINIDNATKTITGVKATTEDAVVTASYGGDLINAELKVKVTGADPAGKISEFKIVLKDSESVPTTAEEWDALPTGIFCEYMGPTRLAVYSKSVDGDTITYAKIDDATWALKESTDVYSIDENGVLRYETWSDSLEPTTVLARVGEGETAKTAELLVKPANSMLGTPTTVFYMHLGDEPQQFTYQVNDKDVELIALTCANDTDNLIELTEDAVSVVKAPESETELDIYTRFIDEDGVLLYRHNILVVSP